MMSAPPGGPGTLPAADAFELDTSPLWRPPQPALAEQGIAQSGAGGGSASLGDVTGVTVSVRDGALWALYRCARVCVRV